MRNKIVINHPDPEELNYSCPIISFGTGVANPGLESMGAGADNYFSGDSKKDVLARNSFLNATISVFRSSGFAVKVLVLFAISSLYFVIGAVVVALYVIFYDKLFKTIFNTPRKRKHKSPYYYKWKNHHLELNYEA